MKNKRNISFMYRVFPREHAKSGKKLRWFQGWPSFRPDVSSEIRQQNKSATFFVGSFGKLSSFVIF